MAAGLTACDDLFDTHPYDVDFGGDTKINARNIRKIEQAFKFRLNAAIGQRITWQRPAKSRKLNKSVSFFYEISSCDLYIRSKFMDSSVSLSDILGLSIGVKFQTF